MPMHIPYGPRLPSQIPYVAQTGLVIRRMETRFVSGIRSIILMLTHWVTTMLEFLDQATQCSESCSATHTDINNLRSPAQAGLSSDTFGVPIDNKHTGLAS